MQVIPIATLVDRFLKWPLPASVRSDDCATIQDYPHRTGTNLLTAIEAREMLEYVLGLGDGLDDSKPYPQERVGAVTCGFIAALKANAVARPLRTTDVIDALKFAASLLEERDNYVVLCIFEAIRLLEQPAT